MFTKVNFVHTRDIEHRVNSYDCIMLHMLLGDSRKTENKFT